MSGSGLILNAFEWRNPGYIYLIDWSDLQVTQNTSARSSAVVNAKRGLGIDMATIRALSKASANRGSYPKKFHLPGLMKSKQTNPKK